MNSYNRYRGRRRPRRNSLMLRRLIFLAAAVALLNVRFGVKQLGGMSGDISGFAITRGELGGVLALAVLIWLGGIR